ncbi:MAG: hypothetical protein Q4C04_06390 [Clostridia bacterium]|nr:hypothetical protein [Clostridia bacterium]
MFSILIICIGAILCAASLFVYKFKLASWFWGRKNSKNADEYGLDPIKMSKFTAVVLLGSGLYWLILGIVMSFVTIPGSYFLYIFLGPVALWLALCLFYLNKHPEAVSKDE